MRKNLLASITGADAPRPDSEARSHYAARGASRSMMLSIDEMAENAKRLVAGELIVSLDPNLIDSSFVSDRLEVDDEDYAALREAIRERGQSTPILVRPHPADENRYMIVYGHRRNRVAKELGVLVRAVVKNVEDIAHVVAQGQENTARANLSFIEKALFARKLRDMGQTKDTIKSALTIDDTLLSRMLSVADNVPLPVVEAIGPAKAVGRDRWDELKKLVAHPVNAARTREFAQSDEFKLWGSNDRFDHLLAFLKASRKPSRRATEPSPVATWAPADKMVQASYRHAGKTFSLSLKSKDGAGFGQFISANLDSLYQAFKAASARNQTGE